MTDLFFVYCPESGFDCFLTLDAAQDVAPEQRRGWPPFDGRKQCEQN